MITVKGQSGWPVVAEQVVLKQRGYETLSLSQKLGQAEVSSTICNFNTHSLSGEEQVCVAACVSMGLVANSLVSRTAADTKHVIRYVPVGCS